MLSHESLCLKWTISYHCGESCLSNMLSETCSPSLKLFSGARGLLGGSRTLANLGNDSLKLSPRAEGLLGGSPTLANLGNDHGFK